MKKYAIALSLLFLLCAAIPGSATEELQPDSQCITIDSREIWYTAIPDHECNDCIDWNAFDKMLEELDG